MTETTIPSIPNVTRDPADLEKALKAVKEVIQVREGRLGDTEDRFVSFRNLVDYIQNDSQVAGALATTVRLFDTDDSHFLSLVWNENDTSDRILNLLVHGATRSLDLYENLTIANGYDITLTAEDAAGAITLDNINFEVEDAVGSGNTIKIVNATSDASRTITLSEDLTVANGYNVTLQALGQANSLILNENLTVVDGQDIDLHASGGEKAQLAIDTQNAERTLDMSGNLTVEATAIVSQDYSADSTTVSLANLALTSLASVGSDTDKFLMLDGSNNIDYATGDEVNAYANVTPHTGWPTTPGVILSFVGSTTRTLTVTDADSAYYYIKGVKYTLGENKTVKLLTSTEGLWYIYFEGATLKALQEIWSFSAEDKALVAIVYWDATNLKILDSPMYELHNYLMDGATHSHWHYGDGAKWEEGLAVSDAGSGTINVTAGKLRDEDIRIPVTDGDGGTLFEQILSPAELPIYYRDGAAAWRIYDTGDKPQNHETDVGYVDGSNNLKYNKLNGTWANATVAAPKHVAYWVVATNNQTSPVSLIMGQRIDTILADAKANNVFSGLDLTGLPFQEMIVLARIILKDTGSSPYYSIEEIVDLRVTNITGNITTPLTGEYVLRSLFDADTFLYATNDNTPIPTSPANVMAALSGHAGAAFDLNTQNLTGLGTLATAAGTLTIDETKALSAKANLAAPTFSGTVTVPSTNFTIGSTTFSETQLGEVTTFFDSTDISAAEAETLTDGSDADALHAHDTYALESVLGTSIGTGLVLDSTTLKASTVLQTYHGIDPAANVQSFLGAADYAAMMVLLSGTATGAFSFNSQNLTSVGTIASDTPSVTTSSVVLADLNSTATYGGYISFKLGGVVNAYLGSAYHVVANIAGYEDDFGFRGNNNLWFTSNGLSNKFLFDTAGNFDIQTHDGSTVGLTLGSVLVTAIAAELNYNADVTAGEVTASKTLVADSDKYINGLQNISDLAAKGAGYWFDGDDDYVEIANDADLQLGTGDGSYVVVFRHATGSFPAYNQLFDMKDDVTKDWQQFRINTSGFLRGDLFENNVGRSVMHSEGAIDDSWHTGIFTIDRSSATGLKLFVDGAELSYAFQEDITDLPGSIAPTGTGRIGILSNSFADFNGEIAKFQFWNLALTAAEVKALSSGVPVPFKYIGASQTLIVPSDDCDDDDTANWTDVNGALTDNGTEYTYTVTTGASAATFTDEAELTVGKRYRASVLAKDGTGAGSTVRINALTNADAVIANGTGITVAVGFAVATVEWTATEIDNKVQIEIVAGTVNDGETVLFDEITTNQIGCILQLEQDSITATKWYDKSGNDLDGTVSGAVAINFPDVVQQTGDVVAEVDESKFSHKVPITIGGTAYYMMLTQT